MRWWLGGAGLVVLILGLNWYTLHQATAIAHAGLHGWDRACAGSPHQHLSEGMLHGIRQAGLSIGRGGWQPTVEWLNQQCQALGYEASYGSWDH